MTATQPEVLTAHARVSEPFEVGDVVQLVLVVDDRGRTSYEISSGPTPYREAYNGVVRSAHGLARILADQSAYQVLPDPELVSEDLAQSARAIDVRKQVIGAAVDGLTTLREMRSRPRMLASRPRDERGFIVAGPSVERPWWDGRGELAPEEWTRQAARWDAAWAAAERHYGVGGRGYVPGTTLEQLVAADWMGEGGPADAEGS